MSRCSFKTEDIDGFIFALNDLPGNLFICEKSDVQGF